MELAVLKIKWKLLSLLPTGLLLLLLAFLSTDALAADTLDFTDQSGVSGAMSPSVYTLTTGVTATFSGFYQYGLGYYLLLNQDHTGDANWKAIYGNCDPDYSGAPAYIDFSAPVQLSSLWFDGHAGSYPPDGSGDPGYGLEINGLLKGRTVWTYSYTWTPAEISDGAAADVFEQVTSGLNLAVDQIQLVNVEDVAFDDLTIDTVPEPATVGLLALAGTGLLMRRKSRCAKFR